MLRLCLIWTCMLSTRSLRWAATWWPVAALLHLGGAIFWVVITEERWSLKGETVDESLIHWTVDID